MDILGAIIHPPSSIFHQYVIKLPFMVRGFIYHTLLAMCSYVLAVIALLPDTVLTYYIHLIRPIRHYCFVVYTNNILFEHLSTENNDYRFRYVRKYTCIRDVYESCQLDNFRFVIHCFFCKNHIIFI